MPQYFFDSSAIVKRYYYELGSNWVRAVCESHTRPSLHLSQLAQVEVVAALRRAGRRENLHHSFVDAMVNPFERHIILSDPARSTPVYTIVPLSPLTVTLAATLCSTYAATEPHPIRSLDALQLASALLAARNLSDELIFITADTRLSTIARFEGFQVINPAYPPMP